MKEEMKIGPKGQVVIPKAFRKAIGIVPGMKVVVELKENAVLVERPEQKTEEIFARVARMGKSVKKLDLDKEYEKRMEERWKKHLKST